MDKVGIITPSGEAVSAAGETEQLILLFLGAVR